MTLTITDSRIDSDHTSHHAERTGENEWGVTWLPDRVLSHEDAVAAMELADLVGRGRDDPNSTNFAYFTWERIAALTKQLGFQGLQAVAILEEWPTGKEDPER
jgi:hypothetical protein